MAYCSRYAAVASSHGQIVEPVLQLVGLRLGGAVSPQAQPHITEKEIALLKAAAERAPEHFGVWVLLSVVYEAIGDSHEAAVASAKAIVRASECKSEAAAIRIAGFSCFALMSAWPLATVLADIAVRLAPNS